MGRREDGKEEKQFVWEEKDGGLKIENGLCRPPWQTVSGLQVLEGPAPAGEETRGPAATPPTRYNDSSSPSGRWRTIKLRGTCEASQRP